MKDIRINQEEDKGKKEMKSKRWRPNCFIYGGRLIRNKGNEKREGAKFRE